MAPDEIVLEAVSSGASIQIDATVAIALNGEELSSVENIVEAAKFETLKVVEKDNETSTAGDDGKGNNVIASVTSNTALAAEGTETAGKEEKKVQKRSAKRKRGKKQALTGSLGAVASNNDKNVGETGAVKEQMPLSKKATRKRARKLALEAAAKENAGNAAAGTKDAESIASKKAVKPAGVIFMCNAKTKADCFKYRVFGLPESKKDIVEKIHKGTKLFLYDFDLKLLYGIYKAASRGGYNLRPKAFNSAFPAQVRIYVVDDCLPLPSEKFKEAIKANYYGKNKFNVQLSDDQVKSLCKLFRDVTKESKLSLKAGLSEAGTPGSEKQGKKRNLQIDKESSRDSAIKRKNIKPVWPATILRGHETHKRGTFSGPHYSGIAPEPDYVREPVYTSREPVYVPRDTVYAPREPLYAPEPGYGLPQHQLLPSHAYDRPALLDYHRREDPPLQIPSYMLPDSRPDLGYPYNLQRETTTYPRYPGTSTLSGSYTIPPGRHY